MITNSSCVNISFYHERERDEWDRYVMENEGSSCYHLSAWKDIVEKTFGHKTYYILVRDRGNAISGILPLVHFKSLLFGNFMISLPYFNYGGILTGDETTRYLLFRKAVELCRAEGADHIELRQSHPIAGLQVKTEKVAMRLDLPARENELWRSFPAKLRSQIRRPSKERMEARIGREEELDSFYAVFAGNMRDLGTPVYSKQFFANILKEFPASWICTVYSGPRRPAASGFLIGFKDGLEIPWASSLRQYNSYSPNMLLYWEALSFACRKGYHIFDFGRSTPGGGTFRFKQQWGARPVQLYWNYWMKSGAALPRLNPNNPKYRAAISVWKKLPINLTKLIGPSIVKNLP